MGAECVGNHWRKHQHGGPGSPRAGSPGTLAGSHGASEGAARTLAPWELGAGYRVPGASSLWRGEDMRPAPRAVAPSPAPQPS